MLEQPDQFAFAPGGDCRGARLHDGDRLLVRDEPVGDPPFDGGAARRRFQADTQDRCVR